VGRPRVDNVVCRCHSSQCLTTRLPDSGLVILVLRTPVHPPLQVTSFTPVSTAHTYISAYTPCSPQLSSNAQTKNHHRPQRSSRAPSKMPTPSSLLTLALALPSQFKTASANPTAPLARSRSRRIPTQAAKPKWELPRASAMRSSLALKRGDL
jgi:hypothetical protein